MTDLIPQVREFHEKFEHPIADEPTPIPPDRLGLRIKLLREELRELREAYTAQDPVAIVDALGDLLYVVQGTALEVGVGLANDGKEDIEFTDAIEDAICILEEVSCNASTPDAPRAALRVLAMLLMLRSAASSVPMKSILKEIHRANMSKLGADGKPIYREDGKILKGPNYSPPDIARVLRAYGFKV